MKLAKTNDNWLRPGSVNGAHGPRAAIMKLKIASYSIVIT